MCAQHVTSREAIAVSVCVCGCGELGRLVFSNTSQGHWLDSLHQDVGDCFMFVYLGGVSAEISVAIVTWGKGG